MLSTTDPISSPQLETDMAWDDADNDGDVDVAIVRKQPWTSPGKRPNVLLVNEGGVLTDRTGTVATSSDVPGDLGFRTMTNDRDVIFVDVDQDGWLDMVTAVTISIGDPKHVGHPRVYRNLGVPGGAWAGFRHEDARVPQLLHFTSGLPTNPRFCSVASGDLTGDGFPDLHFGDYDSSGAGGNTQADGEDMNDRLLVNDGSGRYADESQSRMTTDMLLSAFGTATEILDVNLNGLLEVVKDTALLPPQDVRVIYDNPANEGVFLFQDKFHDGFSPYHVDLGDLNNDGRPDIIVSDDGDDDTFGSNNLIVDLDGDGWNDTLHADVDVDIQTPNRRLHIYHNVSTVPGAAPALVEERELPIAPDESEPGWIGVKGLGDDDLGGRRVDRDHAHDRPRGLPGGRRRGARGRGGRGRAPAARRHGADRPGDGRAGRVRPDRGGRRRLPAGPSGAALARREPRLRAGGHAGRRGARGLGALAGAGHLALPVARARAARLLTSIPYRPIRI